MNVLDNYVMSAPSDQNIVDIFKDEWTSEFPRESCLKTSPSVSRLFEDDRLFWMEEVFGGIEGFRVLDLGPLEAGHAYMMELMGAREIIGVESNTRAFLKCLCVKEIMKLFKCQFMLGDFNSYLRNNNERFDLVVAGGVLYHQQEPNNPIELLKLISKCTDRIYIWTHYYDSEIIGNDKILHSYVIGKNKFFPVMTDVYDNITYSYSIHSYRDELEKGDGFCGGSQSSSIWLTRDSILNALNILGFKNIKIAFDEPNHVNGPALSICAMR